MKKVLLTELKMEKIPQEELITKFYNLKEDPQRHISKKD
jgi:hypothetical protein